jgi:hypothetical protein
MGRVLTEVTLSLYNMVFMMKVKRVTVMNSVEALGIVTTEVRRSRVLTRSLTCLEVPV